ncbi:hypothetical protein TeGR_g13535 [Tetraparma gracilis]|uniref:histidine kinase n=1 Tax=Tetraparma gracilis TaxID=2962635 RepID=A0ABQ6MAU4_9STRA|nr:hypothetical protein TeGR_g13535 [Tetraparma gracilis]
MPPPSPSPSPPPPSEHPFLAGEHPLFREVFRTSPSIPSDPLSRQIAICICLVLIFTHASLYHWPPVSSLAPAFLFLGSVTAACLSLILLGYRHTSVLSSFGFPLAMLAVLWVDYATHGCVPCSITMSTMMVVEVSMKPSLVTLGVHVPANLLFFGGRHLAGDEAFYRLRPEPARLPDGAARAAGFLFEVFFPLLTTLYAFAVLRAIKSEAQRVASRQEAEVLKHSRAKSKFIDYLSHEMRNSLNVISASAEHYLDTKSGDMPRESVEDIRTAVEQSTRIVSDVLTLEKMECGKLELEREAYGVRGMVARTARAFSKDVARRGLRLEIEHPPEGAAAQVVGDEHRAAQILSNFLSNAVKFTRSEVRVSWRVEEGRYSGGAALTVRVEDDGPGIDERDLPLLFQSFTQLRAGKMQGGGGSGLGLAICKEIALLHGGDVGAESTVGVGSVFWARVSVGIVWTPRAKTRRSLSLSRPKGGRSLDDLLVLLVDDQAINIKVLARALSNLGVLPLNVRTARNGVEALAAYEALGPDFDGVVFMDHEMPLLSGSEAALELRRRGFVGAIVGVTGNASEKSRRSFMKAGIDEILVKPFKAEQLGEVLGEWVGIEEQAV